MKPERFILIDDDPVNNYICKTYIKHALPGIEIVSFDQPLEGFNYVENEFRNGHKKPSILLLDINMPEMSGWDFLEKYDRLDQGIKDQITIYILSSSVDQKDMDQAKANQYVNGFLLKPLETEGIKKLYADQLLRSSLPAKDTK